MTERADYPPPHVILEFGDGSYLFKLGLAEIAELQTQCKAGLGTIFARVLRGRYSMDGSDAATFGVPTEADWTLDDLLQTIRLALIGGGGGTVNGAEVKVDPTRARELMDAYVHSRPLGEAWTLATAILTALIIGYPTPAAEEGEGEKKKPDLTTDGSISDAQ